MDDSSRNETTGVAGAPFLIRPLSRDSIGQAVRFVAAGGFVSVVYILSTIVLADLVGLRFEIALPIGYTIGLVTHFTLQRVFVWVHTEDFALPFHHQLGRYLVVAAMQYGLTAASTSLLPSPLGLPTEIIYVLTVGVIVSVNFFVFRHGIFHPKTRSEQH